MAKVMLVKLLLLSIGYPSGCAHVFEYPKLNTFTVGGDFTNPFSHVVTASTQLAPVYNPGGEPSVQEPPPSGASGPEAFVSPTSPGQVPKTDYVTKTVYGFLDFTTTVGSTVMIFTPQSQVTKPKSSKTRESPPPQSSRFTLPPSRPKVAPTPTTPKLVTTPAPPTSPPNLPALTSSAALESSFFEPQTALAIENLFSVTPDYYEDDADYAVESSPVQDYPEETVEIEEPATDPPKPSSNRKSPTRNQKPFDLPPGDRRRPDLNFYANRKKPSPVVRPNGGSTIVPILIEGTGTLSPQSRESDKPEMPVVSVTPSEVIVSATQGFATISVIGPFSTAIDNELGQVSEHYDFLSSEPAFDVEETYDVYDVEPTAYLEDLYSSGLVTSDSNFPTGLVTKLGGTIVSDGLTTVHETSVIGTFIAGQYAQILQSTSHIFQTTPTPELKLSSPSVGNNVQTVKSVIKGSATQFLAPETTAALPLESLFSAPASRGRDSGRKVNEDSLIQMRLQSALSKRRGAHQEQAAQYRSQPVYDPYVDQEDEEDLQRAGSNPRHSYRFKGATSVRPPQTVSTFFAQEIQPTTFRRTFKPSATRRQGNSRPAATSRPGLPGQQRPGRQGNRWRLNTSARPKVSVNRRPINAANKIDDLQLVEESNPDPLYLPDSDIPGVDAPQEETLRIVTSTPADGATDVYYEVATIRSLHTFRVGTSKNTRYVTFTKTFSHNIDPTPSPSLPEDELYETQLFENILDEGPRDISTLPPVDLGENDVSALLETVTETFSTTELMMKTSVLPVLFSGETSYYSLTQTYYITRVVTALKTMPPYEAFSFIPENSLNEFNDQLLAEGTETGQSLHPGELEYDENGEVVDTTSGTRVRPPPGFPFQDPNLADLAGGPFNPDAFEKQVNPQLAAALQQRQQQQQQQSAVAPQLAPGQQSAPLDPAIATPSLTPEQMQQLAYLRLLNPYGFGGFPALTQQQTTVTSSPVTITTDITTTSTRVLRVIFNARPIFTTLSSVEVIHTTLTTYNTATVTVSPNLPAFPFPFPAAPFPVG